MKVHLLPIGVVCLLVLPALSLAQTAGGRITGTVTDATGAALSGASIVVVNDRTGEERQARSNESGEFVVPQLDPSRYTLKASLANFSDATIKDIPLQRKIRPELESELNRIGEKYADLGLDERIIATLVRSQS